MSESNPHEVALALRFADVLISRRLGEHHRGELTWKPLGGGDGFTVRIGPGGVRIILPEEASNPDRKGSG